MAEFCKQCGETYDIGNDAKFAAEDAGLTAEKFAEGYMLSFLCEGCGPTIIDHEGACVADCMKHHKPDPMGGTTWA